MIDQNQKEDVTLITKKVIVGPKDIIKMMNLLVGDKVMPVYRPSGITIAVNPTLTEGQVVFVNNANDIIGVLPHVERPTIKQPERYL